ncbi:sigma-70 family RNA polymerase sigma factor [Planctomycetales bacterium ZRK34]|nr:sigma-70 family RNA polymerase sigma factor [Planctomycetales bacterium ZRK34]
MFIRLYAANQRRIYAFVRVMVPSATDADDVIQETLSVLWRKFDTFDPNTNFTAWAIQVARFEVLKWRQRHASRPRMFDTEVIERLAEKAAGVSGSVDDRHDALQRCLEQLTDKHRQLLQLHYEREMSVNAIADQFKRSNKTIYRMLGQIHRSLLGCIRRALSEEATQS